VDTRAVAVQGVGYSPLALALQGFWGVVPEIVVTGGFVTFRALPYPELSVQCLSVGAVSGVVSVLPSLGGVAVADRSPELALEGRSLGQLVATVAAPQPSGAISIRPAQTSVLVAPRSLGELVIFPGPVPAMVPQPVPITITASPSLAGVTIRPT
jgi:hypothetical protein